MQTKASRQGIRFYQSVLNEGTLPSEEPIKVRGRNTDLVNRRNKCILCRFYYYAKEKKLRYEDIIELLHKEFFLAERTIIDIVTTTSEMPGCSYNEMKGEIKNLQSQYSFLNWKN